jgi:hypothetical protein
VIGQLQLQPLYIPILARSSKRDILERLGRRGDGASFGINDDLLEDFCSAVRWFLKREYEGSYSGDLTVAS